MVLRIWRRKKSIPEITLDWDEVSGRGDPKQRFRIYRRYPDEKDPFLLATCETEGDVGETLVRLGREGAFLDCHVGVLDEAGEKGKRWVLLPWIGHIAEAKGFEA